MYKVKIKKACMECGGTYQEGGASKENMKINSHMGPIKREEANIEVEKGESAFGDINGDSYAELMFFGGKRHHSGGTPVSVPPGTFIFSDTKKLKIKDADLLEKFFNIKNPKKSGYTPAEISKQYKNFNEYLETLKDPDSDNVKIATAYEMVGSITTKLGALALIQEAMKGFPDGVPSFAESAMGMLGLNPEELAESMSPKGYPKNENEALEQEHSGNEEQGEINQGPVEEMQEGEFRFGGLNQYQVAGKTKPNTFTDADLVKGLGKQISPLWNNTKEVLKKEYAYVPQTWNAIKQSVNNLPDVGNTMESIKKYLSNPGTPAEHRKALYDKLPENIKKGLSTFVNSLPDENTAARHRSEFYNSMPNLIDEFNKVKDYTIEKFNQSKDYIEKSIKTKQEEAIKLKKEEDAKVAKAEAEAKAMVPDYIKYYKETHDGKTPKLYKGEGLTRIGDTGKVKDDSEKSFSNEQYRDLIKGLSKVKEKTPLGEYELGEEGAKDFFNSYIDAYEKGDINELHKWQKKLKDETDIPNSVSWLWGTNQDVLDKMETAIDNRATQVTNITRKSNEKKDDDKVKNKYKNYLNLLEFDYKNETDVNKRKELENQMAIARKTLNTKVSGLKQEGVKPAVPMIMGEGDQLKPMTFKDLIPSDFDNILNNYFLDVTNKYELIPDATAPATLIGNTDVKPIKYNDGLFDASLLINNKKKKELSSEKKPIGISDEELKNMDLGISDEDLIGMDLTVEN